MKPTKNVNQYAAENKRVIDGICGEAIETVKSARKALAIYLGWCQENKVHDNGADRLYQEIWRFLDGVESDASAS